MSATATPVHTVGVSNPARPLPEQIVLVTSDRLARHLRRLIIEQSNFKMQPNPNYPSQNYPVNPNLPSQQVGSSGVGTGVTQPGANLPPYGPAAEHAAKARQLDEMAAQEKARGDYGGWLRDEVSIGDGDCCCGGVEAALQGRPRLHCADFNLSLEAARTDLDAAQAGSSRR